MDNATERLNHSRKKMLIGTTIGYGFWWASRTIISLFPAFKGGSILNITLLAIGLIGWGYWVFNLSRMMKITKELKQNPKLSQALNDEFYTHIRQKSFTSAFWILLIAQIVLFLINIFYPLSSEGILNINIFIIVMSPLISFIIFDRE